MLKWTVKKRSDVQDLHQQRSNLPHQIFQDDQTATHERRIHARRSLGNVLANQQLKNSSVNSPLNELKYHKRRSLGSQLVNSNNNRVRFDKENHVTSTPNNNRRHSINNTSLNKFNTTPLNDCSNLQRNNNNNNNNKRKRQLFATTSPSSLFMDQPQTVVLAPTIYAPTLPSFDVEYSPHMKNNDHMLAVTDVFYETPRYFGNKMMSSPQDELPAKRQKTTSVQDLSYEFKAEPISASSPLVKTELTPVIKRDQTKIGKVVSANSTFNSSNVGDVTLEKMIDAILASAKQNKKFRKQQKKALINKNHNLNNNDCHMNLNECPEKTAEKPKQSTIDLLITPEEIEKAADRTIIIEDKADQINEREVKSPIKGDFEVVDDKTVDTCLLKRQKAVRRKNTSNENKNKKKIDDGKNKEISSNSNETSSTNKCLTFSPANNDEELSDKFKRSSMSSISSSCSSTSINRYTKNVLMKGSLELAISADENKSKIYVHVVKCKNLQRSPENIINAYVKCALVSQNGPQVQQNIYQRTAVHRNSSCPIFDHKFIFNLNDCSDFAKRIQLAVWHRNRELKRSEFLGCMSIPVEHILEKNIHGTFLLQPQVCLTNPSPIIPEVDESKVNDTKSKCVKSDNLQLLRYLELEQNSVSKIVTGRTAFTITKQMIRPSGASFGFTITWMQPPKIEIVESNSPADLCGLMPGDHIVFVGNCNIVTMNELDILDLIMKQGDNLTFDVYRPSTLVNTNTSQCPLEQLALLNTPVSSRNVSRSMPKDNSTDKSGKSIDLEQSMICETPKKRPPVPKVAFNENVGSGVFV